MITLPWPPSVNHYHRHCRGRHFISPAGLAFRAAVAVAGIGVKELRGRLVVDITAYMPDRRARDLDNLLKATLDALQHAHFYRDDAQIDELHIVRAAVVPGGRLEIEITEVK